MQQFSDDWTFTGSLVREYRQIGNAVPVGLARAIGQMLIAVANDEAEIKVKRIRGTGVHDRIMGAIRLGGSN
ncbi:DNA cytosine methyltransferase [Dysosmobacter sp.]|uniref:DNA cytosine methyltransferase n=1 Tax=Dysosmobacter sp. TaxID=2591382 RepID=UPI003AB8AE08